MATLESRGYNRGIVKNLFSNRTYLQYPGPFKVTISFNSITLRCSWWWPAERFRTEADSTSGRLARPAEQCTARGIARGSQVRYFRNTRENGRSGRSCLARSECHHSRPWPAAKQNIKATKATQTGSSLFLVRALPRIRIFRESRVRPKRKRG